MSAADAARQAARMEDPIEHGIGLLGMLAGMLLGAIVGAILIAATIATGGAALVIALAVVGAVGAVAGGGLAGGQLAHGLATSGFIPSGITSGTLNPPCSLNVITGFKPQARAVLDNGKCSGVFSLFHFPLPMTPIAEGSATVIVNNMPAARQGDKLVCGANIQLGEPTVLIGGETVRLLEVSDLEAELAEILGYVAVGAAVAGLILLTGGWAAGAICGTVLLKTVAIGGLMMGANWLLGQLGDAIGPGWRDTLQGGFGIAGLLYSGYKGVKMFQGRPFVSEPIDVVTGEVGIQQTDFSLLASLPLGLTRTYLSGLDHGSCFGPKWCSTWGQWITVAGTKAFYYTDDGRFIDFELPEDETEARNRYVNRVRLARRANGFKVRDAENQILHFEKPVGDRWLLTSIEDLNGNLIRIEHDAEGAIREVNHSSGYRLRVESTPTQINRIVLITGAEQQRELMRYEYDAMGRLTAAIDATGLPLRFEYDDEGRIRRWTDRLGTWFEYTFDSSGRCVEATGPERMYHSRFIYDEAEQVSTYENSLGHVTTYKYNDRLQVVETINPDNGRTLTTWDERSNELEMQDPLGRVWNYQYDTDGNLTAAVGPNGKEQRWSYNDLGLPTRLIDPLGSIWRRDYDARGNMVLAASPTQGAVLYELDERGNIKKIIDPGGRQREFGSDSFGLLQWEADGAGKRITYERNETGQVISRTDRLGAQTHYTYDVTGNLNSVTLPTGVQLTWEHDAQGKVTRYTDGMGRTTRFIYGTFGHVLEVQQPSGGRLQYVHDTESNLLKFVNEKGEVYKFAYDSMGRVLRETDFSGRTLSYEHDLAGQLIKWTNGRGETVVMEYEQPGHLTRKVAPDGAISEYEYDPLGNIVRAKNAVSEIIYERDEYRRVVREIQNGRAIESTYDRSGLRTRRRTSGGLEHVYTHDQNGLPVRLELPGGEYFSSTYDANYREVERRTNGGLTINFAYDGLNRLTHQRVTAPPRRNFKQAVNAPQLLSEQFYRYDDHNNPVEIQDEVWGNSAFSYDPNDMILSARRERGVTEEFSYDATDNITGAVRTLPRQIPTDATQLPLKVGAQKWSQFAGGRVSEINFTLYEYDADGRVVAKSENNQFGGLRRWQYSWNSEGQLQSVKTPDGVTWQYIYDAIGRRIGKKGPDHTTTYVWDDGVIAEVIEDEGDATVWLFEQDYFRPLLKQQGGQTFHCITDHIGTAQELITGDGHVAWSGRLSFWGELDRVGAHETSCPLRFQGQWFDDESGLSYNWNRYYDPFRAGFISPDPLGLDGDKKLYQFPETPASWIDPLGLANDWMVYGLYEPGATEPYYVGKTNDMSSAQYRHSHPHPKTGEPPRLPADWQAKGYEHKIITDKGVPLKNLSKWEARGLEDRYIDKYGTLTGKRPGNVYNSIRPDRTDARAAKYRNAAKKFIKCKGL